MTPQREEQAAMSDDRRKAGVFEMIDHIDAVHHEAHERLRKDFTALEARQDDGFALFAEKIATVEKRMEVLVATPVDVTKIVMTPRIVLTILVSSLTIAGGIWASTAGLRSDVRDIITQMNADRLATAAQIKLEDERATSAKSAIDEMKRQLQLEQYEIQALKDLVTADKKGKRP